MRVNDKQREASPRARIRSGSSAPRAVALVALAVAFMNCRCRTRYEPAVTAECHSAAAQEIDRDRGRDGGLGFADFKRVCEDCCRRHGLGGVDPGSCECGDIGLDVLLK